MPKHTWEDGELITAELLNDLENRVEEKARKGDTGEPGKNGEIGPQGPPGPTGPAGKINFGESNIWTGTNKFTKLVTLEKDDDVLLIQPETPGRACFVEFKKNKSTRAGILGYSSASNFDLVVENSIGSANIDLKTTGGGKVRYNNRAIATEEFVTSTVNSKISEMQLEKIEDASSGDGAQLRDKINEILTALKAKGFMKEG